MKQHNIFDETLKKELNKLQNHKAPEEVWFEIENELLFEDELHAHKGRLTKYVAPKDVWDGIESKLSPSLKEIAIEVVKWTTSAAAILLFILAVNYFDFTSQENTVISYSEEIIYSDDVDDIAPEQMEAEELIAKYCKTSSNLCEKPVIKENLESIQEINDELENLEQVINSIGASPSLMQSKVKMENLKVELTKEILENLKS